MRSRAQIVVLIVFALSGFVSCDTIYDPVGVRVREGIAHHKAGRYDDALTAFQNAQIDAPNDRRISLNIGNTLSALGRHDEAADAFTEALSTSRSQIRSNALYNLGNTRFDLRQLAQAAENYEQALEINPDDIDAKFNLELVQLLLNQAMSESADQERAQRKVSDWAKQRAREAESLAHQQCFRDAFQLMKRTIDAERDAAEEYGDFVERLSELTLIFEGGT